MSRDRILVVGGGIGGAAAGIALARQGFSVAVFERAGVLREVGAGITLFTNAVRALRAIGASEAVLARAVELEVGELRDARGRVLVTTPVGDVSRAAGAPSVALARPELLDALVSQLPEGALCLGRPAVGFEQRDQGVELHLADGSLERGRLLVGADGLRSVVRAALHGEAAPRYAGYTGWRALIHAPLVEPAQGRAFECWGAGRRFGAVRLSGGRVYWFASETTAPGGCDGDALLEMRARFADWEPTVAALLDATPAGAILRHDVFDRDPFPSGAPWGRGATTLLGDAAHASTPNLGQGAALAIEDAWALARTLARLGLTPEALRSYERARSERTRKLVLGSRRLGWIGQRRAALACAARNACMRLAPKAAMRAAFAAACNPSAKDLGGVNP